MEFNKRLHAHLYAHLYTINFYPKLKVTNKKNLRSLLYLFHVTYVFVLRVFLFCLVTIYVWCFYSAGMRVRCGNMSKCSRQLLYYLHHRKWSGKHKRLYETVLYVLIQVQEMYRKAITVLEFFRYISKTLGKF